MGELQYHGPAAEVTTPQGEYVFKVGEWVEVEDEDLYENLASQASFKTRDADDEDPEATPGTDQGADSSTGVEQVTTPDQVKTTKKAARQTPAESVADDAHNTDGKADGAPAA